jgi:hypothetical protein
MDLSTINRIAFQVCLACLIVGGVTGLFGIWVEELFTRYTWAWKLEATCGLLFVTAVITSLVVYLFQFLQT